MGVLRDLNPDDLPSERKFGLSVGCILLVLSGLPLISGRAPHVWLIVPAIPLIVFALVKPSMLVVPNRLWFRFGLLLHAIINPIVLSLLFFLVVTPVALAVRLAGKRLLQRHFDPDAKSYWMLRDPPGPDAASIRNQF